LSYVGLRSIAREQELQRGLLIQGIGRSLGFEIDGIEQRLEEAEKHTAREFLFSRRVLPPSNPEKVNTPDPWIERVFVFDAFLNLQIPPPFAAERLERDASPLRESLRQRRIDQVRQLELKGDFGAAVSSCQQILTEHLSLRSKVVLNTYLARSAAALGNRLLARRAYDAIIRADSTLLISQPIPYAAFAWFEVVDDLLNQGRASDALQKTTQFYRCLLDFYYHLSSSQYDYFSRKLHSLTKSFERTIDPGGEARTTLISLEERERLLANTLRQAEEIRSWLRTQGGVLYVRNPPTGIIHHSLPVGERTLPISLISIDDPPGPRHWVVLVVLPEEVQREFVLPGLQSGDLADGFDITLRRDSSQRASQTELASFTMNKTSVLFPSSVISVSARQTTTVEILGVQTSLLSIGFGVLVVGIVLLGILIIYRDIRREEELSSMKSEFISNVSHELKTPIAAIRMLADNLRQSRVPEEARKMEYYHLISKESARLSHLIENILDFARIEEKRKAYHLERCDVSSLVSETVRQFTSLMEEKSQRIEMTLEEPLPEVLADPEALALALFNLLDNAAKYSEKESQINVRVLRNDGFLCIEVEDHGVGIPKKDQARIFEKFYRVQRDAGKRIPGSGIGLTLIKEIAEAHNGRVELKSDTGAGSTFRLMLPTGG